ncbi:MAG: hypothetical protein QXL57_00380 [Candidatus Bathyarchaeia archaeon]
MKNQVQGQKHSLKFYLLIAVVVIYSSAMIVRVYDAYLQGDVWLAFSRRSDVGYPVAHILGLIALIILLYATFGLKKKTRQSRNLVKKSREGLPVLVDFYAKNMKKRQEKEGVAWLNVLLSSVNHDYG